MTVKTGLSDFHKMTGTEMKVFYKKQKKQIAFMFDVKNTENSIIQMTAENNDL